MNARFTARLAAPALAGLLALAALNAPAAFAQQYALELHDQAVLSFAHHPIMQTDETATWEMWARHVGATPGEYITVRRYKDGQEHKQLGVNASGQVWWRYAGSPWAHAGSSCSETGPGVVPLDGAWHHIAFVRRATSAWSVYVDGAEVAGGGPGGCCWLTCDIIATDTPTDVKGSTGWQLRGLRVSDVERYAGAFTPAESWIADADTAMLLALGEGAGDVVLDSGPAGQVGTISGNYSWIALSCEVNRALWLDGTPGSYALVPADAGLDLGAEYTIEAWAWYEQHELRPIVHRGDPTHLAYTLSLDDTSGGRLNAGVNWHHGVAAGTWHSSAGGLWEPGRWHHVAAVHEQGQQTLYLDGVAVSTKSMPDPQDSAWPLRIGGHEQVNGPLSVRGKLDRVRLWNVARTSAELQAAMHVDITSANAGQYAGLVAAWNFEGDGNDATGVHHATLTGNAAYVSAADLPGAETCAAVYCTAKVNSCGGLPSIASSGAASASAGEGFVVSVSGARHNRPGILLHGANGRAALPFQGGLLCVATEDLRRTPPQNSTGGTPGTCDGVFVIDLNAFAAGQLGGNPQAFLTVAGQVVDAQWWGRDVPGESFLSDALEFVVQP